MPATKAPIPVNSTPTNISSGLDSGDYTAQNIGARIYVYSSESSTPPADHDSIITKYVNPGQYFTLSVENDIYDYAWCKGDNTSNVII